MDQVHFHSAMQDALVKVVISTVSRKLAKYRALVDLATSSLVREAMDMLHALEENAVLCVLRDRFAASSVIVRTAVVLFMLMIPLQQ